MVSYFILVFGKLICKHILETVNLILLFQDQKLKIFVFFSLRIKDGKLFQVINFLWLILNFYDMHIGLHCKLSVFIQIHIDQLLQFFILNILLDHGIVIILILSHQFINSYVSRLLFNIFKIKLSFNEFCTSFHLLFWCSFCDGKPALKCSFRNL